MTTQHISVEVNGTTHEADVEPRLLLVHFLRDTLGLTGTHVGCDTSNCGACTVHVDGRSAKSCTMLAVQADGAELRTIEGLADGATLHPLQQNGDPSEQEIREGISGNLCRCTGYVNIVKAIQQAAGTLAESASAPVVAAATTDGQVVTAEPATAG